MEYFFHIFIFFTFRNQIKIFFQLCQEQHFPDKMMSFLTHCGENSLNCETLNEAWSRIKSCNFDNRVHECVKTVNSGVFIESCHEYELREANYSKITTMYDFLPVENWRDKRKSDTGIRMHIKKHKPTSNDLGHVTVQDWNILSYMTCLH